MSLSVSRSPSRNLHGAGVKQEGAGDARGGWMAGREDGVGREGASAGVVAGASAALRQTSWQVPLRSEGFSRRGLEGWWG
jgi:hypothetical protein